MSLKWALKLDCIEYITVDISTRAYIHFDKKQQNILLKEYKNNKKKDHPLGSNFETNYGYEFVFQNSIIRQKFLSTLSIVYENYLNTPLIIVQSIDNNISNLDDIINDGDTDTQMDIDTNSSEQQKRSSIRPIISGKFEKYQPNDNKSPKKYEYTIYSNLCIEQSTEYDTNKKKEFIVSIHTDIEYLNNIPPQCKDRTILLNTTGKPLHVVLQNQEKRDELLKVLQDILIEYKQNHDVFTYSYHKELLQATPLIEGYLNKYIKGRKKMHMKYFAIYRERTIRWGSDNSSFKYSAKIRGLDASINEVVYTPQDYNTTKRILCIHTDLKTLEVICENQDTASRWIHVINSVLNDTEV